MPPNPAICVYPARDGVSGQIQSVGEASVQVPWQHLRDLLLEIGRIEPIRRYNKAYLSIQTPDVLARIGQGDSSWEELVPPAVAEMIKTKGLFGYRAAAVASPDVR
jgi:hypothetical protein